MADIAALGLVVDSSQIPRAAQALQALAAAAREAEAASVIVTTATTQQAKAALDAARANRNATAADIERAQREYDLARAAEAAARASLAAADAAARAARENAEAGRSARSTSGALDQLATAGKGAAGSLLQLAAGAAGLGALSALAIGAATAGNEIEKLSRLSNSTTDEFQRWASASKRVGIEADGLADILKDVLDKIGDFRQTGAGGMVDFFEQIAPKIGITADAFKGLTGTQALQLYVDSLEKANLNQADFTFYMEAIASESTLLLPLLQNGAKGLKEFADQAERFGAVLTQDQLLTLKEAKAALNEMGVALTGLGNTLGVALAPIVVTVANGIREFAAAATWAIGELEKLGVTFNEIFNVIAGTAIAAAIAALVRFSVVLTTQAVIAIYAAVAAAINYQVTMGTFSSVTMLATGAVSILTTAVVVLSRAMLAILPYAIIVGMGYLIAKFYELSRAAGGFGEALTLVKDVAAEVWERINIGGSWLSEMLRSQASEIRANYAEAFMGIAESFAQLMQTIGPGIDAAFSAVGIESDFAGSGDRQLKELQTYVDAQREAAKTHRENAEQMRGDMLKPLQSWQALSDVMQKAGEKGTIVTTNLVKGGDGLVQVTEEQTKKEKEKNDLLKQAEAVIDSVATATEKYAKEQAKLDVLLKGNYINQDVYNKALDQAARKLGTTAGLIANYKDKLAETNEELALQARLVGATPAEASRLRAQSEITKLLRENKTDISKITEEEAKQLNLLMRKREEQLNVEENIKRQEEAYDQVSQSLEKAFDRVGDAITEAFAQGKIQAVEWGNVAKAIVASLITDFIKLAAVAPLKNALFGQNNATFWDLGSGSGGTQAGGGGNLAGDAANMLISKGGEYAAENLGLSGMTAGLAHSVNMWGHSALGVGQMAAGPMANGSAGYIVGGTGLTSALGAGAIGGMLGSWMGTKTNSKAVGGLTGAAGGAIASMALAGSIIPGIGTLIGAAVGAILGMIGTQKKTSGPNQAAMIDVAAEGFAQGRVSQDNKGSLEVANEMGKGASEYLNTIFKAIGASLEGVERREISALHSFDMSGKIESVVNNVGKEFEDVDAALTDMARRTLDYLIGSGELQNVNADVRSALINSKATNATDFAEHLAWAAQFETFVKTMTEELSFNNEFRDQGAEQAKALNLQVAEFLTLTGELLPEKMEAGTAAVRKLVESIFDGSDIEAPTALANAVAQAEGYLNGLQPSLLAVGYSANEASAKIESGLVRTIEELIGTGEYSAIEIRKFIASMKDVPSVVAAAEGAIGKLVAGLSDVAMANIYQAAGQRVPTDLVVKNASLGESAELVGKALENASYSLDRAKTDLAALDRQLGLGSISAGEYQVATGLLNQALQRATQAMTAEAEAAKKARADRERAAQDALKAAEQAAQAAIEAARRQADALADLDGRARSAAVSMGLMSVEAGAIASMAADQAREIADAENSIVAARLREVHAIEAQVAALDRMIAAQQYHTDVMGRAYSALGRSAEAQLLAFDLSAQQQIRSAQQQGYNPAALSQVLAAERAKLAFDLSKQDYLAALDRQIAEVEGRANIELAQLDEMKTMADALSTLATNFGDLAKSLRLDGNLSPLLPAQKMAEAQSQMAEQLQILRNSENSVGDRNSAGQQIQQLVRDYLDAAQDQFGRATVPYQSAFDEMQTLLSGLSSEFEEASTGQAAEIDRLTTLNDSAIAQLDALRATREQAAALGERELGSLDSLREGMDAAWITLQETTAALTLSVEDGFAGTIAALVGLSATIAAGQAAQVAVEAAKAAANQNKSPSLISGEHVAGSPDKPTIKALMEATGLDLDGASRLLYGAVGSMYDGRDWESIMAGDQSAITDAIRSANNSLINTPRPNSNNTGEILGQSGNFAVEKMANGQTRIIMMDSSGNNLRGLSDNPQDLLDSAWDYGISPADMAKQLQAAYAAAGLNSKTDLTNLGAGGVGSGTDWTYDPNYAIKNNPHDSGSNFGSEYNDKAALTAERAGITAESREAAYLAANPDVAAAVAAGLYTSGLNHWGLFGKSEGRAYASGGWVTGGVAGMDSVRAMLMPGEFVMPTDQATLYSQELEAMRSGMYRRPESHANTRNHNFRQDFSDKVNFIRDETDDEIAEHLKEIVAKLSLLVKVEVKSGDGVMEKIDALVSRFDNVAEATAITHASRV